jgi:CHAD domain-containing protein
MSEDVGSEHSSRAFELSREESVGEGMRRIALGRAEKALERLRGVTPDDEGFADAVHGARKDLKKLRAVVRLLRDRLGEDAYEEQNGRYRDAGRALSASRDAQVKLETLDSLGEHFGDLPPAALAAWREGLERDRDRTVAATDERAVAEAIELIEAGRDRIEGWDLGSGSWGLIDRGLTRAYRRGRRAMRQAEAEPGEESFHRWRKRAKDLWYALRLLRCAWPEAIGPSAEEAHRLTDLLGDHHDLAVLRADLSGRRFSSKDIAVLSDAVTAREGELASAAFDLGRRLYAEKPKAFRVRLRAYWRAWRTP